MRVDAVTVPIGSIRVAVVVAVDDALIKILSVTDPVPWVAPNELAAISIKVGVVRPKLDISIGLCKVPLTDAIWVIWITSLDLKQTLVVYSGRLVAIPGRR